MALGVAVLMPLTASAKSTPVDLKCEHLENPIGIGNPSPRLSWRIDDNRKDAKQTAYRIVIGRDSLKVLKGDGDMWDTGKVESGDMLVSYAGPELMPCGRYYWTVTVRDEYGYEHHSAVNAFETGIIMNNRESETVTKVLDGKERKVTIIKGDYMVADWISDEHNRDYKPASYFRSEFEVGTPYSTSLPNPPVHGVKSARAYVLAAGLFELYINGERVGDHFLDPMYTRFDRRNLYVTFDVTPYLRQGDNAVGVVLGNGWYNHQAKAVWDFDRAPWRNRPAFCMEVWVTYDNGSIEGFITDDKWKTSSGALVYNNIYTGEHYDARLEQPEWSMPGFDDSKWDKVVKRPAPSNNLKPQQVRPIRKVKAFPAVSVNKIDDRTYVYDFGQNMSGVTKINVQGKEGTELRIKHGERLHDNGRLDMSNIDVYYRGDHQAEPFQTDILTLSGRQDEFQARFGYKGFRYVEVTSSEPVHLDQNSLIAYFVHSDVPPIGKVSGSNPIIEKLWRVTNNAYLSNLMGYPTDCPQREKNGWTGDGHFAIESALYNFDGITVYEKWLADHRDEQRPDGVLPDIIPTGGWGYGTDNGLDWTSTIAIIPWNLYLFYGDSEPLRECYENIKRYVDYVDRMSPSGLTSWGRGDWVPVRSRSDKELTSSVYFYVDAKILADAAKLFGREDDYKYYSALAEKIKNAINDKFLNRETGVYASGTQTELSVPLYWGVVPQDMVPKVAANLARKVEEAGFHLDVGVLGAKAILNALSENGHADAAYKVAVQDTYPSWGWWVANGATTLLENWDLKATRDISDNHMMFGEIGAWFYKGLGGIFPDPQAPGFEHIVLRPNFVGGLDDFEASFKTPRGQLISKWEVKGDRVTYEVTVPANSSATLYLPTNVEGRRETVLGAGTHKFKLELK